jgi:N-acetylglucosaminyldiphosphoundecaprenol N-acetyl-beta-D-mannosaminyltransferase
MIRQKIITMDVDVTALGSAVDKVLNLVGSDRGAYVCVSNVHMCMETFDSSSFRGVVNQADLVIPDGKPLSIAQKLLGHKNAAQVRGTDIMKTLCELSGKKNLNIGFYGGSSDAILDLVKSNLLKQYPDIKIAYSYSPPFRPLSDEEDSNVVEEINNSNVDILFVGIGCPKQEIWMAEHKDKVSCVMLGVGAAFDFLSGHKKEAPRWVQSIGMEWFFRLVSEPRRLWKRYFYTNTKFIVLLAIQLFSKRLFFGNKK